MRESLVRKCRLLSVLQKSVINSSWFFRKKKKKKYVPYPSFHEEERSYAICCRHYAIKGSEGWRNSSTPWRALVIWGTSLVEERIPTLVVLLRSQTQVGVEPPYPLSHLFRLWTSFLFTSGSLFLQVRQALNLWIVSAVWSLYIFLLWGHVACLPWIIMICALLIQTHPRMEKSSLGWGQRTLIPVSFHIQSQLSDLGPAASFLWGSVSSWFDSITNSMDMNLGRVWDMVRDREAWHVSVHGVGQTLRYG